MKQVKKDTLFHFVYHGTDRHGQSITGELSSSSLPIAKAQLRKQGIVLNRIRRKSKPVIGWTSKIKPLDIALFARQLATMTKAGVPLLQALTIVIESLTKANMIELVTSVKLSVESGTPLASALSQHPKQFDSLFCALIEAGEYSGSLDIMLERIATYKEKSEHLKSKIKKAIKYPIAVILVAMTVSLILLLKVVPVFSDLFAAFGSELPPFTQFVVSISNAVQRWWALMLALIILAVFGFFHAKNSSTQFVGFLDRTLLKLPIVGPITYQAIIARFSRTLATTYAAGVPLLQALESTAAATDNQLFFQATQQIRQDVATGQPLNSAMLSSQLFPTLAIQMVSIGEHSGCLDEMLDKVAVYYENEVDNAVEGLTSLMEPVIMVVLGLLIGGLVIAMYLPIFQLGSVIG
ncbi:type II secretion system F family protein [Psychrobacter sp. UBA3962]|uniref:type II secretion system F family protein n=1 Tax=Psychrobacter sp. UBA3962 TaxID=1947352 RepID=UPI0025ED9ECB|nr:type II secretion system F family protein [Psychrobacter sp. UBA3962]